MLEKTGKVKPEMNSCSSFYLEKWLVYEFGTKLNKFDLQLQMSTNLKKIITVLFPLPG